MKKSQDSKGLSSTAIPLAMIFGTLIGLIACMIINPDIIMHTLVAGSAIGLLAGTVIYALWSGR